MIAMEVSGDVEIPSEKANHFRSRGTLRAFRSFASCQIPRHRFLEQ
jgi:hypothetical protein